MSEKNLWMDDEEKECGRACAHVFPGNVFCFMGCAEQAKERRRAKMPKALAWISRVLGV